METLNGNAESTQFVWCQGCRLARCGNSQSQHINVVRLPSEPHSICWRRIVFVGVGRWFIAGGKLQANRKSIVEDNVHVEDLQCLAFLILKKGEDIVPNRRMRFCIWKNAGYVEVSPILCCKDVIGTLKLLLQEPSQHIGRPVIHNCVQSAAAFCIPPISKFEKSQYISQK